MNNPEKEDHIDKMFEDEIISEIGEVSGYGEEEDVI